MANIMGKVNINHIKSINNKYNIFTSIRSDPVSVEKGVLSGTSSAIKDIFSTTKEPTTCSSKILETYIAPYESTVTNILENEGTIIVGKTNMDEFAMGNSNLNSNFGPTLNPLYEQPTDLIDYYEERKFWTKDNGEISSQILSENFQYATEHTYLKPVLKEDFKIDPKMRIVGGSSGGSAASVASGLVDFAIGTDTGGSVRLPASYSSVLGFKPTYGRISRWGLVAYAQSLDTVGIFSKDIGLLEKVFTVLDKHDEKDPTSLKDEKRIYNVAENNGKFKVGLPIEFQLNEMNDEVRSYWFKLLHLLEEKGLIEIYPVSIPSIKHSLPTYYTLCMSEASSNLSRYDGIRYGFRSGKLTENEPEFTFTRTEGFGEEVKRRITLGTFALSSYGYDSHFMKATKLRSQLINEFNIIFKDKHELIPEDESNKSGIDFIISPTSFEKPSLITEFYNINPVKSFMDDVLTIPASLAGLPTLSMPFGKKSMGFQITGQHGYDYKLLDFAKKADEFLSM